MNEKVTIDSWSISESQRDYILKLEQENQQLKDQLEAKKLDWEIAVDHNDELRNIELEVRKERNLLKKQLKQRDEVIDEAIEFINHTQYDPELRSHVCGINFGGTMKLLEILQKYKGDNNE